MSFSMLDLKMNGTRAMNSVRQFQYFFGSKLLSSRIIANMADTIESLFYVDCDRWCVTVLCTYVPFLIVIFR